MVIGVPTEIKPGEKRVAMTPPGVRALVSEGHRVLIQMAAGLNSGLNDAQFSAAGAQIVDCAEEVWRQADLVLKVKEPLPAEYPLFHEGLILFTYLHLAACPTCQRPCPVRPPGL